MSPNPSSLLDAEDFRRAARRYLPRVLFDYMDRGSEQETALRQGRAALDRLRIVPSVLNDVNTLDLSCTVLGKTLPTPLIVAPTAIAGMIRPGGEARIATAAARSGIPVCLATQSIVPIETVVRAAPGNVWFQLYVWRDRRKMLDLVARVKAAGVETLVVTVDTAVQPLRHYNRRNGFSMGFRATPRSLLDIATHPIWTWLALLRPLLHGRGIPGFPHYPEDLRPTVLKPVQDPSVRLAHDVTWSDIEHLRTVWKGKLVIKGLLSVEDVVRARRLGADGIVVSTHGGRNLDSAPPIVDVLPGLVAESGNMTVIADSGIRQGSDVFKLLALGADAVMIGRLPLYGLAAEGTRGVERVLTMLLEELRVTMGLSGQASLSGLGPENLLQSTFPD
ncbi:alpha-hydroxy-acid oxidizing enzyme [Gluconobacter kanchanaburiensis NBRC 103587]|uniref:Alpha-hydroxy-acid oxidizing enzyme n=2 Tax=Gluconobacter kanchanaburiensis TaxID=563199 RepID=A0A511BF77_9PROT|nr:alpha-hydroxy-acid oxidizing protein [Gluconobacter kanchanaburiensis]GEK96427.1 alpha-hydroxy-acid oxidizing enzyme [Gluconobacter kanchanaburiensis NBRC 103587]